MSIQKSSTTAQLGWIFCAKELYTNPNNWLLPFCRMEKQKANS
jgi:hypothetical protein